MHAGYGKGFDLDKMNVWLKVMREPSEIMEEDVFKVSTITSMTLNTEQTSTAFKQIEENFLLHLNKRQNSTHI